MTQPERSLGAARIVPDTIPSPRSLPFDAPWTWLAAAWRDLWHAPRIGLTYGSIAAVMAALVAVCLALIDALPLFPALIGGFLLLGPLVAVGLYEASRQIANSKSVTLRDVALAPVAARGQLAFAGAFLLLVFFAWLRIAMLLFMLFVGTNAIPPPSDFVQFLLFTPHGLGLMVVGSAVGAIFAVVVFATTVFAIPLLLTKRIDVLTAAMASINAVTLNAKPMALWATLIVVIMAAGFATFFVGLVIAFPLIGHATWHAFTDVYGETDR
jgi:uncharacterized membrane protein